MTAEQTRNAALAQSLAAQARGLALLRGGTIATAGLQWAGEPSSPLGHADPVVRTWQDGGAVAALRVLDCAYAPLRLDEEGAWAGSPSPHLPSACWQLWTPNKAMGLALGVDAAAHEGALEAAISAGTMAATIAALTFLYCLVVVLLTQHMAERMRANPTVVRTLEKLAGVFLIGFGVKLAISK
mgnify:CR=1 FL=1